MHNLVSVYIGKKVKRARMCILRALLRLRAIAVRIHAFEYQAYHDASLLWVISFILLFVCLHLAWIRMPTYAERQVALNMYSHYQYFNRRKCLFNALELDHGYFMC